MIMMIITVFLPLVKELVLVNLKCFFSASLSAGARFPVVQLFGHGVQNGEW